MEKVLLSKSSGSLTQWLDTWALRGMRLLLLLGLIFFLLFPLLAIFGKVAEQSHWLAVTFELLGSAHFFQLLQNSFLVSIMTVVLVIPLAGLFAWGIERTCMPGKKIFRAISLLPLMAPSMLSAIAMIYLFGNQGILKNWFPEGIYGVNGIVLGQVFYNFPTALMILLSAMRLSDARLYDAAHSMGASNLKIFLTVTWPAMRYGVFAASCLVFTQTITNFGIPVIIGGDYPVLAVEAYKSVVGQQQFSYGALIGSLLMFPAILSFLVDILMRRIQKKQAGSYNVPLVPVRQWRRDMFFFCLSGFIAIGLLGMIGIAVCASFITFWPYNLSLSLVHYQFDISGGMGWRAWCNSLILASSTALVGTPVIFFVAWLMEKTRTDVWIDMLLRLCCMLPMAVPGLVMGLGYVFFFNNGDNPVNGLYGGLALMTICCIVRFLTTAQLTATTALQQLSKDIEAASLSLNIPLVKTFWCISVPVCLPAILDIFRFLFVSAMTSVSALIFLYNPDTLLASVTVLNMDDAGNVAGAAALSSLILLTSSGVSLLLAAASHQLVLRASHWRSV
ncbi:putative 2-aminoethylphosphonate ABC transporter permease subunit [Salmonella enterica subsp. enterica]|nr:putative 2-aminoethylphosphonate ABC transporter permease subunit [Salmonella enterica]EBY0806488.1 putative 2-aminoethylphosphonate ABC transporter permease subunit [Salmonella enterica subsp. enterica serovar Berlin]ECF3780255.1 putative 2-aminoethylphosphonate ABC transporter permease subunit [Salmonella enterica subsp. enterica serovar Oslo]EDR2105140.1 putative 2-aminoethylphosphonate ABC transporter permease subunit [Salmonella enterica subsp. enterica]EDW0613060.1 putative 2-aminoethy